MEGGNIGIGLTAVVPQETSATRVRKAEDVMRILI